MANAAHLSRGPCILARPFGPPARGITQSGVAPKSLSEPRQEARRGRVRRRREHARPGSRLFLHGGGGALTARGEHALETALTAESLELAAGAPETGMSDQAVSRRGRAWFPQGDPLVFFPPRRA